ncbi:MAG: hypothetical protein LBS82_03885 [Spirochaetaceae bacterium]|nr:hypothetical protein [Spirochaetaceae bacterium]
MGLGSWNLEVVTRSTSGTAGALLKEPRTIVLPYRLLCVSAPGQTEETPQDPPVDA